jgi:DUF1680 family protein
LTRAHPYVDATRGCVAIERGPLVYCIEGRDQRAAVNDLALNPHADLRDVPDDELGGGAITVRARGGTLEPRAREGTLYGAATDPPLRTEQAELVAIPYYAWANRGADTMRVWIPIII